METLFSPKLDTLSCSQNSAQHFTFKVSMKRSAPISPDAKPSDGSIWSAYVQDKRQDTDVCHTWGQPIQLDDFLPYSNVPSFNECLEALCEEYILLCKAERLGYNLPKVKAGYLLEDMSEQVKAALDKERSREPAFPHIYHAEPALAEGSGCQPVCNPPEKPKARLQTKKRTKTLTDSF